MECERDKTPPLFTFSRAYSKDERVEIPAFTGAAGITPQFSKTIIMVIEDMGEASVLAYALKGAGIRNPIGWFRDTDSALGFLAEAKREGNSIARTPLFLILDGTLRPGAIETMKCIRREPEYRMLPIVVVTGTTYANEVRPAYEAGANWHLSKATEFTDLMRLVRRIREFWSYAMKPDFYQQLVSFAC
jgi:two-component system response regulator